MSTELHIRMHWLQDEPLGLPLRLEAMMDALEDVIDKPLEITNFICRTSLPGNIIHRQEGNVKRKDVLDALASIDAEGLKASLYASLPCWRFDGGKAYWGAIPVVLNLWEQGYGTKIGFETFLEGQASIVILNNGPFLGLLYEEGEFLANEINAKVQENLEFLLSINQSLVSGLNPDILLMGSDTGEVPILPMAHLAWFSHRRVAAAHLNALHEFLRKGNPVNHIPPIANWPDSVPQAFAHGYLGQEENAKNYEALKIWVNSASKVSDASIQAALETGKLDFFESGDGFMVMDYPFALNALLVGFFNDLVLTYNPSSR